jgi:hypothetical protein
MERELRKNTCPCRVMASIYHHLGADQVRMSGLRIEAAGRGQMGRRADDRRNRQLKSFETLVL